jgi:ATP-binding cassette subfamily B protein
VSILDREPAAASPFVPPPIDPGYEEPRAGIRPERELGWLRRAAPIVFAHKAMILTSLGCAVVGLVIQVQIPAVLQQAIDTALPSPLQPVPTRTVGHFVIVLLALGAAKLAVSFVNRLLLFKAAYRIEYDLRNIVYRHLARLSFSFYDRVSSGNVISRANSDIRSVQMYLSFAPSIVVQCSIAFVAFWKMVSIDPKLACVAMVTLPFVYFSGVKMRNAIFPVSWIMQARVAEVAGVVQENTEGVRVVKSFAAEERQLRLLDHAARRVRWGVVTDADIRARWSPVIENLSRLGSAFVLLYGGYEVIHGRSTIGEIIAFNAYVLLLQPPFRMLGMLLMMGRRASASAGRIYEILDEEPTIVDAPGAVDLVDCRGEVELDDITYAYPNSAPVLDGLSLHLKPGDTVALVGRTGSGKSTIARLLCRFYDVDAGVIRIDGHDIRDVTQVSLRAGVGMVLDEPFLFSISVRDNIAYGKPNATDDEVIAAAKAAAAHDFILELADGYDTVVGERGYTLSGGQRQRISIARTLLQNPPILILDDATSAIDTQIEHRIHEELRTLMQGRTTLIIAHRLSTIGLADRVAVLDGGRIVAEGPHTELLANEPLYSTILAQQMEDDLEAELGGDR